MEALVEEYLAAQSLKILPQGEFGDAVNQFVNKDDKHAMDTFVSGSLANQLKDLLALGAEDEELDGAIDRLRDERERQFQAGLVKSRHKRMYKPRPDDWDSDMEGPWEHHPGALVDVDAAGGAQSTVPAVAPVGTSQARSQLDAIRARAAAASSRVAGPSNSIDEDLIMDDFDDVRPIAKTAAKRTTKAAPATASRQRAPAATTTRKATAPKRSASGRKKGPFEDSDDSDEDALMIDDDGDEDADEVEDPIDEPVPQPSRRGRAAAAAAPARARATAAKPAAKPAAGRMRQTTLQVSQSQAPSQRPRAAATRGKQNAAEVSADEISDDSDDFEPPPTTTRSRRR